MSPDVLPAAIHASITALSEKGKELLRSGNQHVAYDCFAQAWDLIPEPKANWEAATWVLSALGNVLFSRRQYNDAKSLFLRAVQCPGGFGNPYIHLRIGQCQLEGARENLTRAYMGGGLELFAEEDPKYADYLRGVLDALG